MYIYGTTDSEGNTIDFHHGKIRNYRTIKKVISIWKFFEFLIFQRFI